MQRRTVHFKGRVQGVGFRYTTAHIAQKFPVAGYVQNLANGEVLVVVEGSEKTLDEFLGTVHDRMRENVESTRVEISTATNEFDAFEIRY
jgi:acylphosphatase